MPSTTKCVICLSNDINIAGHVHKGNEIVLAGLCNVHLHHVCIDNGCKGCYGEWKEDMGYDSSFGKLMYIDSDKVSRFKK